MAMTRIKGVFGLFSGFLALAALGGCMTSGDSESSSSFSLSNEIGIAGIEEPDEEAGDPGVLTTVSTIYTCVDGELEEKEVEDGAMFYAITGGSLYLWYEGNCSASKFSGSSSDITGTWTSTSLSVRIPSAYRPVGCEGTTPYDTYLERILDEAVVTYTISSSKIKGKVSGTFCLAPVLADQYGGPDANVVSSGCAAVKLESEDAGRIATISATYNSKDDTVVETIAYNGETCRIEYPMGLSIAPPTCSEEEEEDDFIERMEAFQDCMEDSDFYEDFGYGVVERRASGLPTSLEKALERARPF
jgi:hypothetical protein